MLSRAILILKYFLFWEVFRRLRAIFNVMDRRGKQLVVILQINQSLNLLLGTIAFGGVAGALIVLSKPQMVLGNRYISVIYDALGFENQSHFLLLLSGFLLLFIIMQQVFLVVSRLVDIRLMNGVIRRCLVMLHHYYIEEDYEEHIKRGGTSSIGKLLVIVKGVVSNEIRKASTLVSALVNIMFIAVALYVVHAQAMIIFCLSILIIYAIFFVFYRKRFRFLGEQLFHKSLQQVQVVSEATGGAVEIKLRGQRNDFVEEANKLLLDVNRMQMKQNIMSSIPQPFIKISAIAVLYIIVAYTFISSEPENVFSIIVLFAAAAFRLLPSLGVVFNTLLSQEATVTRYKVVIKDLRAAKKIIDKYEESTGQFQLVRVRDKIIFDNVTYAYPETDKPVVNNLNLALPANKTIALFGPSGVGKSTVIRLISGLLQPQKGQVLIDGKSLHGDAAFKQNWQKSSSMAFQKPFFMNASLAMNVAFEATEKKIDYERVRKSIELAQLGDFVASLPGGLDTEVAENADLLSGGQRQRLAIARVLYRKSSILIMDEATNALDLVVEKKIVKGLKDMSEDKMVIIIAHRPETMRFADIMIVMKEDGSVAQGTYNELIKKDADFKALVGTSALLATS